MKSGYKCSAKRIAAIGVMLCMLVLTCLTVTSVLNTKAEESIGQGHVNYDVTDLRIRKSPVSGSVITKVDGGFMTVSNVFVQHEWLILRQNTNRVNAGIHTI